MKIYVSAFGKLKFPGLRLSANEYLKRIKAYHEITETEYRPSRLIEKSQPEILLAKEEETKLIASIFQKTHKTFSVALDPAGKQMPTLAWASMLKSVQENQGHHIHFWIGSSVGFLDSTLKSFHKVISLGPQTTSHELARVVLYEQIYRALSYNAGHPYHNE